MTSESPRDQGVRRFTFESHRSVAPFEFAVFCCFLSVLVAKCTVDLSM